MKFKHTCFFVKLLGQVQTWSCLCKNKQKMKNKKNPYISLLPGQEVALNFYGQTNQQNAQSNILFKLKIAVARSNFERSIVFVNIPIFIREKDYAIKWGQKSIFRQHAASICSFVHSCVSFVSSKKNVGHF